MKKKLSVLLICMLVILSVTPAYAYKYEFELDYDEDIIFGKPTETLIEPDYSHIENARKNKDGAYLPPGYGVFSGDIPTEPSSKYHEQDRIQAQVYEFDKGILNVPDPAENIFDGGVSVSNNVTVSYTEQSGMGRTSQSDISYTDNYSSEYAERRITQVSEFSDGSIGRLKIPAIDVNVKVREGTDQSTLRNSIGHFEFTSQWAGLIGLAAHNRGSADYFGEIKNLETGDTMTYETTLGTREYEVYYKEKISDTDFSNLVDTADNTLCLITCVENKPSLRWCLMAREI